MDSLGPEWRQKLPPIPVVPVSAQKRWNSLPTENHKETAKTKSKETTATKNRGELGLGPFCVSLVVIFYSSLEGDCSLLMN